MFTLYLNYQRKLSKLLLTLMYLSRVFFTQNCELIILPPATNTCRFKIHAVKLLKF